MGVPKFFRYISERYPCLSEPVKEFQIPDFDNLYLDMNGIIHCCSHPNDYSPENFFITEKDIFASIFHYIEVLFNIIKPKKLFFLAVDGVAPRAKMNQQRARRFRTAKDAEKMAKMAVKQESKVSAEKRFDSNCITPGTVFMRDLHAQLKYFLTNKISTDPLWQSCKVILSGHQTPGEGEHKIMEYIRYMKTLPDYDSNTKHCLYGLDADLIMLGLCTHEPHFSLLREKVKFGRNQKKIVSPDQMEFYLLHLSLMREYLDLEFQELKKTLPFEYSLENIIDDWILMGFLVGNDFIPHVPDLHINRGALPVLYNAYKKVLPQLDGYLNENGYLNLPRFQEYMKILGDHDLEAFEETFANIGFLEEKVGKKMNSEGPIKADLEDLIKATEVMLGLSDDEGDDEDTFFMEFSQHKKNYYVNKLDYSNVTEEVLQSQAEGYIRAIQWNLHYYYQGCQSWSWYYPHHYAPFISDITNFKDLKLDFEMGKPFLPFEQLLAVLPAASKNLLPKAYQDLMTSPNSPIKDFYPEDFETDLSGKQHEWEGVVLIPLIDEKRLLNAMEPYSHLLTEEEKERNRHGPMHVFAYSKQDLGIYRSNGYFPAVEENHAVVTDVFREEVMVEASKLKHGLRPGVLLDVFFPGFATFRHIPYTGELKVAKVKVFEFSSSGENMIITVTDEKHPPLEDLARSLLGKTIYVNWPHLMEARAVGISDGKTRYSVTGDNLLTKEKVEKSEWAEQRRRILSHYFEKRGVELGKLKVLVYVTVLEGRSYQFRSKGKVTNEKIWSTDITPHPLPVVVKDIRVHSSNQEDYLDFQEAFKVDSVVFMLGQPHFGSMGRILDSSQCYANGRLNVALETANDPPVEESVGKVKPKTVYLPATTAALRAGIAPRLLSRITGAVMVDMSKPGSDSEAKLNIGLNMKFPWKEEEYPGFTKRENSFWLYSTKAVDIICEYVKKFSRVVEYVSNNPNKNVFSEKDIFPEPDGPTELKEMVNWLKNQEYKKLERVKCGTKLVDEEVVKFLENAVAEFPKKTLTRTMQVKPSLLYKSDLVFGNTPPVRSANHCLLDRVVAIRSSYTVPVGMRGYIIGIHPGASEADHIYDVLFDEPFLGGMKMVTSSERVFKMCWKSFLNISDANRSGHNQSGNKAVVRLMPRFQPQNSFLRPSGGELQTSAFVEWSNRPPKPPQEDRNEEFQKIWSNLQQLKPQEETNVLKKILKIESDSPEKPAPVVEDPVKSFFEIASKAAKDFSPGKKREPANAPGMFLGESQGQPQKRYCNQLFSCHQRRNLGQPKYRFANVGGKVVAEVYFNDGRVYSGARCEDKESACESAARNALAALGEISQNKPPHQNRRPPKMPYSLPNPPSQWVGQSKVPKASNASQGSQFRPKGAEEKTKNNPPVSSKLSASALEFVPLQAITGKRNVSSFITKGPVSAGNKRSTETRKKPEMPPAKEAHRSGGSSATRPSKRKQKIAANLGLDPNLH